MSTMTVLQVPFDGWTTETLPDTDFRYELVDGALLVTPPPHVRHMALAGELGFLLRSAAPDGWSVGFDPGVYFDLRNYREPDLCIYMRAAVTRGRLVPGDVLLAVEVVSPGSVSTDRVAKPSQYAAAGIPHFWLVEQEPLTLTVFQLEDGVYRETGHFEDLVIVDLPVSLRFRLGDLLDPERRPGDGA